MRHHLVHGLARVERNVLREHRVGKLAQVGHVAVGDDVVHARGVVDLVLARKDVHRERADLSRLHAAHERVHVHEARARRVDEHHAVAHRREGLVADHAVVLGRCRHVEGDDVGAPVELLERHVRPQGKKLLALVRVKADHRGAKAPKPPGHRAPNAPRAHDAHREGAERAAHEAREGEIVHVLPVDHRLVLAQRHEHEHEGEVGHAVRRVARVGDADAQALCGREVDVVRADRSGDKHAQPAGGKLGEKNLVVADHSQDEGGVKPAHVVGIRRGERLLAADELVNVGARRLALELVPLVGADVKGDDPHGGSSQPLPCTSSIAPDARRHKPAGPTPTCRALARRPLAHNSGIVRQARRGGREKPS